MEILQTYHLTYITFSHFTLGNPKKVIFNSAYMYVLKYSTELSEYREKVLRHVAMLCVDRCPPPLGLGSISLATDSQSLALVKRQLVSVLGSVVACCIDNAVVRHAQLADHL